MKSMSIITIITMKSAAAVEIEEAADKVYADAVHNLFLNETDPRVLIGHKEIYGSLEACCDLCDHASDAIDQIIIKNT